MKLEIGNFHVKDIQFGSQTIFKDGVLIVNKEEAIASINPDKKLKNIDLHVVRPGDKVRMLPVKDVVEPRVRPDGRAVFPGYIGPVAPCGDGVVHAMKDMSVLAVGKYGGWMDGMLDMSGPAAELTIYSKLINLVIVAEDVVPFKAESEKRINDTFFRLATHLLADYVGTAVKDQQPEDWERFELTKVNKELPRVALVVHLMTNQGNDGYNHLIYGRDIGGIYPMIVNPNEVLDGAAVSDHLSCSSARFATYDFQNFPLIKQIYEEHGKTLRFVGVIFSTQDANVDNKERDAIRMANTASLMECDGAIVVIKGSGNINVDLFKSITGLEKKGIKTVGVAPINPGRDGASQPMSVLDPIGDALVIGGSSTDVIELPPMERVLGDLEGLIRDNYPGAWAIDPLYGPSLREDGSLIIDTHLIFENDGCAGWSNKTIREF